MEADRLAELLRYGVLDTAPEEAFDRLTNLAAEIFDAPIALVSLIDAERQWFKSRHGLDIESTDRGIAFCDHAIRQGPHSVMVAPDATTDPRFMDNPLVTGEQHVRFYAGATLTTPSGHNLGTLCVIDTEARPAPTPGQLKQLSALARIVVDEFELRRADRESREHRRQLELAESMAGIGRWRVDLLTGQVTWSDAVYVIHGLNPGTFQPNLDDAIDFFHPQDRQAVRDHVQAAIQTKGGFQFQLRLIRPDGDVRHVTSKGACDLGPSGEPVAVIGVFRDVTRMIRRLEEVARSEAQYRLLAENASDLIMRKDRDGRVTYVSPAAFAVTGRTADQVLGRLWSDFVHLDDADGVAAARREQLEGGGALPPRSIEYRLLRPDGRQVWLQGRPTFAVDPVADEAIGITDVVRDISAQKENEERLRQARAEAEAAAAVKAEFMANMSHELRTPLTAVLGFSALIAEQPGLDPVARTYLSRISTAGQVLLATVNDILDFSKLESGQVLIKPREAAPAEVAGDMLALFSLQAQAKGLTLQAAGLEALPPRVLLDVERVRQVLLNLVGNAVKFTEAGGVRLEARFDDQAAQLKFTVIDTGPGIAPGDVERLFRRFSQVDGSTTRRHGGAGLGLAICKGLVEAMGGQIGVDSVLGRGSGFWVSIPAPPARPGVGWTESPAPEAALGAIPTGCRVLLAEDNPVNRQLVAAVLQDLDVELTEVCDGLEAVDAALALPFDVILMDMRMPLMDGAAATRRIRAEDGPNLTTPIIALSADMGVAPDLSLFDALVAKPLSANALIQAMTDVMAPPPEMDHAAA